MNKQPWLPTRPKHSLKCNQCKGKGTVFVEVPSMWYKTVSVKCNDCGGKGFK